MENGYVVYDGSKGTMLMQYGLEGCAEEWNLSHSDSVYNGELPLPRYFRHLP